MNFERTLLFVTLALALSLRPWRMLVKIDLLSPLLGTLVILPWFWALPHLHIMPIPLQLSGACAVALMLGWPMAMLALTAVALISSLIAPAGVDALIAQALWQGIVPATLSLCVGVGLRHWVGNFPFIYILARAFAGTVVCTFVSGVLAQWAGYEYLNVNVALSLVGRWLLAWGDGFITGMLTAIFVAYRPQWLATWSDRLYLQKKNV